MNAYGTATTNETTHDITANQDIEGHRVVPKLVEEGKAKLKQLTAFLT